MAVCHQGAVWEQGRMAMQCARSSWARLTAWRMRWSLRLASPEGLRGDGALVALGADGTAGGVAGTRWVVRGPHGEVQVIHPGGYVHRVW